jgi:hypothetical protein
MALLVVSYSRLDAPQVRAIVKLLQGSVPAIDKAVYWDDEFRTGEVTRPRASSAAFGLRDSPHCAARCARAVAVNRVHPANHHNHGPLGAAPFVFKALPNGIV